MRFRRVWLILLAAVVVLQALVRPAANLLSVRDDSRSILSRISVNTDQSPGSPIGVLSLLAPDYQCGFSVDIERLEPKIGEISTPLRRATERMYQGDLLTAAAESLSPWEIRLWQLRYGVGLWSGRLDEGPVSNEQVMKARNFAKLYYNTRLRQFACDTARGMR
jgi:hypothetical protein